MSASLAKAYGRISLRTAAAGGSFVTSQSALLLIVLFATAGWSSSSLGVDDPANYHPEQLISPLPAGALGRPFGESVVVQGKVIDGPFKYESSTEGRLLVQRINGVATQQGVVIRFEPITPREWWDDSLHPMGEQLWKALEKRLGTMKGKSFEMRGYERGEHAGMTPEECVIQTPVQSRGFEFRLSFRPLMLKEIPEVRFTPADFLNRIAEFEGRAETRKGSGWLIGAEGWVLRVRDGAWPVDFEKREIIAKGRTVKTPTGSWHLEEADARLLHLSDQRTKEVKLDGVACSLNGYWWFEYRGEKLYVENQKDLPGWTNDRWKQVTTISGILDRAKLPDLDQITRKVDRDLREYYIVRRAAWSVPDQVWKKPTEIPKCPPLTTEYLKSCGVKLEGGLQKVFDEWSKESDR